MRTYELAKILLENPDYELLLQRDPEGNAYSYVDGIEMDVVYDGDDVYSKSYDHLNHGLTSGQWQYYCDTRSGYAVLYPQ